MNEEALKSIERVKEVFTGDAKTLARLDAYLSDKTDERIIAFCSKDSDKIKKELSQWESRMKKKNQPATTTSTEAETTTKKQTFEEVIAMYATNTNKIVFNDFKDAYNIITNLEKIIEKVKEVQSQKKDAHIQKLKEEQDKLTKEIEELSKL
ncbi:hypothetical protein BOVA604_1989 [Bacteroides ovatus]|jgi:hypothetical protein|uniref:hypothetical protein n=1 Tax=Bacteroides ovatus TaxID=28116 RepID=UPI0020A766AD|nr:hypothetical protein [Bacteroides ovatus]CAG9894026.1 hypothetical protein BOVA604_1989 [Bacteroides ovatus]